MISNEKSLIFLDLSVYLGAYDKGGFISEGTYTIIISVDPHLD